MCQEPFCLVDCTQCLLFSKRKRDDEDEKEEDNNDDDDDGADEGKGEEDVGERKEEDNNDDDDADEGKGEEEEEVVQMLVCEIEIQDTDRNTRLLWRALSVCLSRLYKTSYFSWFLFSVLIIFWSCVFQRVSELKLMNKTRFNFSLTGLSRNLTRVHTAIIEKLLS